MDSLIKRFDFVRDGDLAICDARGVAYQVDMKAGRLKYDDAYLEKFEAYDRKTAAAVNVGRCAMVQRHTPQGASLLDIGAGSGDFVRAAVAAGFTAKGFDVIPATVKRLQDEDLYANDPHKVDVITLWDTIEHMDMPEIMLRAVSKGALLFVSIPVFDSGLRGIRGSKHYRPGEHLYYWTTTGFIAWMTAYEYRLLEQSTHETEAGRENIAAFAFKRDLPDYHDHLAAYQEMHSTRHYGSSATELHLNEIARVVMQLAPASILDYGCGRSDLVAHFWRDGKRKIARYDPAISQYQTMPEGRFDLVLCCDVMEHIPMAHVDRVLAEIKEKCGQVLFTISTKLARARLPDGRNAHVTLMTRSEWLRWIEDVFGPTKVLPSKWEHELILLTRECK